MLRWASSRMATSSMSVTVAVSRIPRPLEGVDGKTFNHACCYGSTIVVVQSTVLSGAMARMLADEVLVDSGSMASA